MGEDAGVLYVATGEDLRSEAVKSAEQVARLTELPISIATDQAPESAVFDHVSLIQNPAYSLRDKVMNVGVPYDRTLFLDTDTYLCDAAGVHHLLELLERFDVAAAHDTGRTMERVYGKNSGMPEIEAPQAFPMVNTGVLALADRPATHELLERWRELYHLHEQKSPGLNDQGAFRQALIETDVRIGTFPPEYNFRAPKPQYVFGPVRLIHGHAPNLAEIAEKLNQSPNDRRLYRPIMRLGDPTKYQYIHPQVKPGAWIASLKLLRLTIQTDGLIKTVAILILGGLDQGRYRLNTLSQSLKEKGVRSTIELVVDKLY